MATICFEISRAPVVDGVVKDPATAIAPAGSVLADVEVALK